MLCIHIIVFICLCSVCMSVFMTCVLIDIDYRAVTKGSKPFELNSIAQNIYLLACAYMFAMATLSHYSFSLVPFHI